MYKVRQKQMLVHKQRLSEPLRSPADRSKRKTVWTGPQLFCAMKGGLFRIQKFDKEVLLFRMLNAVTDRALSGN